MKRPEPGCGCNQGSDTSRCPRTTTGDIGNIDDSYENNAAALLRCRENGHTRFSKHANTQACCVLGSGGLESGGLESRATDFGSDSAQSGGLESGGLESGDLESGDLESGGLESPSTGFGSDSAHSGGLESGV